jgi:undecaprenyl-diphosphatase
MGLVEAIVLGLIQGLTEFIPVSSSAHLRIAGIFLEGGRDPGAAFTAIIQLGTETAVLVYFWKDIVRIVRAFFLGLLRVKGADGQPRVPRTDHDYRMGWLIIIGSLPIVVLGVLLQHLIENNFRSLWIVAINLIVFGILLGIADRVGRKRKTLDELGTRDGVIFGFAQALALIPGVSRSGGTHTGTEAEVEPMPDWERELLANADAQVDAAEGDGTAAAAPEQAEVPSDSDPVTVAVASQDEPVAGTEAPAEPTN